jgi:hypothetical protein
VPDDEGDLSRDLYALQAYHTPPDSEDEDEDENLDAGTKKL